MVTAIERAERALRDGNFALYGEEWKKLKPLALAIQAACRETSSAPRR